MHYCRSRLVQMDWLSVCDPLVAVYSHDADPINCKLLDRTEWIS